jgi:hypothetical protein
MWAFLAVYLIGYVVTVKVGFWMWRETYRDTLRFKRYGYDDFYYRDLANEVTLAAAIACLWWPMVIVVVVVIEGLTILLTKPMKAMIRWVQK